jgi:large conductance mechanosensitive channel
MKPPIELRKPKWIDEFRAFIARGNVVDLAVGIIIGAAFTSIVNSLVKDLLNPIIGLLVGGVDFTNVFITLRGPSAPTLDAARQAGAVTLNIGLFINAVIQFLIVAFAIFWLVKLLTRVHAQQPKVSEPPKSEVLLTEIRDILRERPTTADRGSSASPVSV